MNAVDYLKKEIKKTGYPLEIEISSLLDQKWQYVMNTDTYFDRDEQKLRDIDIYAFDNLTSGKIAPLELRTGIAIECKKDEDFAWVFFSRPFVLEFEDITGQYVDEAQVVTKNTENFQIMEIFLGKVLPQLHYSSFTRKAVSYNEFYLQGKKESFKERKKEIFEAQNQVKKYIDCSIDQLMKVSKELTIYPIEIDFPCIVFDGLMFEAILERGGLQLHKTNHVILSTSYRSQYSIFERSFLIDVVHKDSFGDYLKLIRKDVSSIQKSLRKNSSRILRKIDDTLSLLGMSRTRE
jgi:hypothetical protein